MKILQTSMWLAISVTGLGLMGCDVTLGGRERHETVYVERQPQYVQPQTVYVEPEPQYVVVQQAPPEIIVERRPAPPSGLHVWIDGSWAWSNNRYSWQAGRYELPPQQDAVWVSASYVRDGNNYRYTPGQWKKPHPDNGHDHK